MSTKKSILDIQAKREWMIPKSAIEIFRYNPDFCPHLSTSDKDWVVVLNDEESYWEADMLSHKLAVSESPVEFKWRGKTAWLCGH